MAAKLSWALIPFMFVVQQDERVCAHRDGRGTTQAVDPAAVEKAYREAFSTAARIETAATSWKRATLPACSGRQTRRVQIPKVSETLVGRRWVFSREDPPISADAYRWFHVRCVPSAVTVIDPTHLEIVEE